MEVIKEKVPLTFKISIFNMDGPFYERMFLSVFFLLRMKSLELILPGFSAKDIHGVIFFCFNFLILVLRPNGPLIHSQVK